MATFLKVERLEKRGTKTFVQFWFYLTCSNLKRAKADESPFFFSGFFVLSTILAISGIRIMFEGLRFIKQLSQNFTQ
jgi:hypothetical protein